MSQNVSPKKMKAITAMIESSSVSQAASAAGINRKTLARWLTDPDFQAALAEARREFLRHGTSRICGMLGRAIDVLASALAGAEIEKNTFLAAKLTIETALAIQAADFDVRITQIEHRIAEDRQRRQVDERRAAARYLEDLSDDQIRAVLRSRVSGFEEGP